MLKGGYLSWEDAVSGSWWQEIWFDTAQPSFRNIGPIDPKTAGNLRAAIDRWTMENTMNAIGAGRQFAEARHRLCLIESGGFQCRILRDENENLRVSRKKASTSAKRRSAPSVRRNDST